MKVNPALSPLHLAFSAGLCSLLCGREDLDSERKALRNALPTFLEFSWEVAGRKERTYVKFRDGATPHNVSRGGAFL